MYNVNTCIKSAYFARRTWRYSVIGLYISGFLVILVDGNFRGYVWSKITNGRALRTIQLKQLKILYTPAWF